MAMSKNATRYKTDLSPLQRKMVDIASLTHRHPPFGEVRWRHTLYVCEGDMIDTKPMRNMRKKTFYLHWPTGSRGGSGYELTRVTCEQVENEDLFESRYIMAKVYSNVFETS